MKYLSARLVFQEVPDETSVAFLVTGCPLRCPGCHSADAWSARRGTELTSTVIDRWIADSRGLLTCAVFLGGEWEAAALGDLLRHARGRGLRTCLYTGLDFDDLPEGLLPHLDYLKFGPWIAARGGLDSPETNQRFIELPSGRVLNEKFHNKRRATW